MATDPRRDAESLAEQAYRRLEEMIVTLELPPGSMLSEPRGAVLLGMGRTPVREALQRLADDHLVEAMPGRGVRVSDVNVERQLLLLETRRALERLTATRAARRASATQRHRLAELATEMERAAAEGDETTFIRLDVDVNTLIAAAGRNTFTSAALMPLHALSRRFWFIHHRETATDLPAAARLHADLLRAIAAGDEEGSAQATDALLDWIEQFTKSTMP
jgi:DNA-binding GntR family transcriptional regulator